MVFGVFFLKLTRARCIKTRSILEVHFGRAGNGEVLTILVRREPWGNGAARESCGNGEALTAREYCGNGLEGFCSKRIQSLRAV